jgi:hypothetical protein
LSEWNVFYEIVGSAAGALTGLQFVSMALTAEILIGDTDEYVGYSSDYLCDPGGDVSLDREAHGPSCLPARQPFRSQSSFQASRYAYEVKR